MEGTQAYTFTLDRVSMQLDVIYSYLSHAYWCEGIERAKVQRAIANSTCVGAFTEAGAQVAFARAISDKATFAYLCDVFVLPGHEGQGIARTMVTMLRNHEQLKGLRRWLLATKDAHGVYAPLGFRPLDAPEKFMHIE